MLHTFFRLMELDCSLVPTDFRAVPTLRRVQADVVILDLDLPDLRALDIARDARLAQPAVPIIFLTDEDQEQVPFDAPVIRKPHDRFEELLRLFEMVLAV